MITKQELTTALQYLGNKIDALRLNPQKVELDLTSKAVEKLQEIDHRQMNTLLLEMKAVANGQTKSNTELISTLQAFEKATKDDSRLVDLLKTSQNLQRQTLTAIEKMAKELKPEKDDKEYRMLQSVEKAIKAIKLEEKPTDVSELKTLSRILTSIQNNQKLQATATIESLKVVTEVLKTIPSQIKLEIPKTFKLDNEQLRSIRSAGGGAISLGTGGERTATQYTVDTLALTSADTEYSFTFPANTLSWTLKLRNQGATLFYSHATGKLPVSGDNSDYMTLLPVGARSQDNVEWSGKTLYFESDTATQVVEIEIFTL